MPFLGKNKKKKTIVFFFFLFFGMVFFASNFQAALAQSIEAETGAVSTNGASAGETLNQSATNAAASGGRAAVTKQSSGGLFESIANGFSSVFKWILYGIFVAIGWLVSAALTLFEWAINPDYVSGSKSFFNASSTYEMWKFIRDFFNLFFILVLLYTAFGIVFQIAKDYKKAILHLVIMVLLVNFSFPISRFLIDATNVPMYFFANQIAGTGSSGNKLSSALSASQLENILIKKENNKFVTDDRNPFSRLIMAIVFMFIFAITMVVLAVMFVIRLIALLILVIFSSAGFVGSVVPGMESIAKKWWTNFWNYALFGPAAMLMILIATRFFSSISGELDSYKGMTGVASIVSAPGMEGFIGSMAFFSIPIVMLWFAIGLSGSMSLAGGKMMTGWGEGLVKKGLRKGSGLEALQNRWKAYSSERKKRADAKFANNIGTGLGKWANKGLDRASASRNKFALTSTQNAKDARLRYVEARKAEVEKAKKDNMIGELNDVKLREIHERAQKSNDVALHAATTEEMSKRNLWKDTAEAAASMEQVRENYGEYAGGVKNSIAKTVDDAMRQSVPEAAFTKGGVLQEDDLRKAIAKGQIDANKVSDVGLTANFLRLAALEGKLNQNLIQELRKDAAKSKALDANLGTAINGLMSQLSVTAQTRVLTKEEKKARDEIQKAYLSHTGNFHSSIATNVVLQNEVIKKADADTLARVEDLEKISSQMAENMNPARFAAAMGKLAEEHGRDVSGVLNKIKGGAGMGPNADAVKKAIGKDARLRTLV